MTSQINNARPTMNDYEGWVAEELAKHVGVTVTVKAADAGLEITGEGAEKAAAWLDGKVKGTVTAKTE